MRAFRVPASCIVPLRAPADFYTQLLRRTLQASNRISLAALYVGTGKLERELVQAIADRARCRGQAVDVTVQLDYSRSLRHSRANAAEEHVSSAHLMLDMLRCSADQGYPAQADSHGSARVRVGLTLMPQLRGALGRLLPPRYVEGIGVMHVKAYAFDDSVLLSGANMSADYFTNRQDRYMLVEDAPAFASYVHNLLRALHELPGSHVLSHPALARSDDPVGTSLASAAASSAVSPSSGGLAPPRGYGVAFNSADSEEWRKWVDRAVFATQGASEAEGSTFASTAGRGGQASGVERRSGASEKLLDPAAVAQPVPTVQPLTAAHNAAFTAALRELAQRCSCGPTPALEFGPESDACSASAPAALLPGMQQKGRPHAPAGVKAGADASTGTCTSSRANTSHADEPPSAAVAGFAVLRPRLQAGLLGVRADEEATVTLLTRVGPAPRDCVHVATGYFNLPNIYTRALLSRMHKRSAVHILTSSPAANGFYRSPGPSAALPTWYSELERAFYEAARDAGRLHPDPLGRLGTAGLAAADGTSRVRCDGGGRGQASPAAAGQVSRPSAAVETAAAAAGMGWPHPGAAAAGIALHEYTRPGWTFHGKGIWWQHYHNDNHEADNDGGGLHGDGQQGNGGSSSSSGSDSSRSSSSMTTLVGSPNYGARSLERDLELNVEMSSSDASLVARLAAERDAMWGVATAATAEASAISAAAAAAAAADAARDAATVGAAASSGGTGPSSGAPPGRLDQVSDSAAEVTPVGPHLPPHAYPGADVWAPGSERRLAKLEPAALSWHRGWWVPIAGRLLAPFF